MFQDHVTISYSAQYFTLLYSKTGVKLSSRSQLLEDDDVDDDDVDDDDDDDDDDDEGDHNYAYNDKKARIVTNCLLSHF